MISILFSTYNGEDTLHKMLNSFTRLIIPEGLKWEIIAVDNNSSDSTPNILASYSDTLPISIIHESKQGKNAALNTGLKAVNGELIVLTDDDIIAEENWLLEYQKLVNSELNYDIFGGEIQPFWTELPPQNLLKELPLVVMFALTLGEEHITGEIEPESLFGPNMAVRKTVFDSITFNENIGPSGQNYVMGSETDFLSRAKQQGFRAYYSDRVSVHHIIQPTQFEISWVENRAFKAGRAFVHEQLRNNDLFTGKMLFGSPRWALKKVISTSIQTAIAKLFPSRNGSYKRIWDHHFLKGLISEYRTLHEKGDF